MSPLVWALQHGYVGLLAGIIKAPRGMAFAAIVVGLISLALLPRFQQTLMPAFREPNLLIQLDSMPGTASPEMDRIVARVSTELQAIPGVHNVGAHIGRAVMSDHVVSVNASELWVSIEPEADYDTTVTAIRQAVAGYPGLKSHVQTYLNDLSSGVLANTSQAIGVRIYGVNWALLRTAAEDVKKALTGTAGIVDLRVKQPDQEPTLEVMVDLAKAQQYGIKPGDVRRTATTLLSGLQVGSLFEESKVFDVVVLGTPATRRSLTSMKELLIDTPNGQHVRLGDVAEVKIVPVPDNIQHEAVSRYMDIDVTVQGRDLVAVANDIKQRLLQVPLPLEFHAEVFGTYAEQQTAQRSLLGFVVAAAIGIFLLLQAAFKGWRLAGVYFLTLPAALLGGVLAAYVAGGNLSLGSLVGFLTLFGITARNGMLLISHYQQLQLVEGEGFGSKLILRGAKERLAPILMTALATGFALAPVVFAGNIAGNEIVRPMAIVVMGGLVTATLLNLFVVPAVYLGFGFTPEPEESFLPVHSEASLSMAGD